MDREEKRRGARFLAHEFQRLDFGEVKDPRGKHGEKKWSVHQFSIGIVAGVLSGRTGLRQMERLTSGLSAEVRSLLGIRRRLPDTTVRDYVVRGDWEGYRDALRKQAKSLYRSKVLERAGNMPIGMVCIDGKYRCVKVKTEQVEQYPFFQAQGEPVGGWQRGEVRTISVSLVSSRATFCLDCVPVRRETNEMGMFPEVFQSLVADWGDTRLPELVATDSGYSSLNNATLIDGANLGYLIVLDDAQPELIREAKRQLDSRRADKADASGEERYRGKTVKYRLWRTTDMTGWNGWNHLRQVLRVERREVSDDPVRADKVGIRYFLTNQPVGRLSAEDWLCVTRRRWGVENGTHWTLDAIMEEDDHPWVRNPHGMLVVQMLRRIALNILALYRGVHLRSADNRLTPWKHFVEDFHDVLKSAVAEDLMERTQRRRLAAAA